jgi:hypothetical protein
MRLRTSPTTGLSSDLMRQLMATQSAEPDNPTIQRVGQRNGYPIPARRRICFSMPDTQDERRNLVVALGAKK